MFLQTHRFHWKASSVCLHEAVVHLPGACTAQGIQDHGFGHGLEAGSLQGPSGVHLSGCPTLS